jgi:hypothetical protein
MRRFLNSLDLVEMPSPLHPISINSIQSNKVYHVSHNGDPLRAAKVTTDVREKLPGGVMPGGVTVVFSYEPYDAAFIAADDKSYRFYSKDGPSHRRSSSVRRSSSRRRRSVRRTKSAPRQKQRS